MTLHFSTRLRELDRISPPPWRRRPRCDVKSRQLHCTTTKKKNCSHQDWQVGSGHHWTTRWFPRLLWESDSVHFLFWPSHRAKIVFLGEPVKTRLRTNCSPLVDKSQAVWSLITGFTPSPTWECLWRRTHIIYTQQQHEITLNPGKKRVHRTNLLLKNRTWSSIKSNDCWQLFSRKPRYCYA